MADDPAQGLRDHLDAEYQVDLDEQEHLLALVELAEAAGDPDEAAKHAAELWACDSDGKADWALRMMARHVEAIDRAQDVATRLIERVRNYAAAESARNVPHIEFFEKQLAAFHQAQLDADPKAKTIRLPSGTLTSRRNTIGKVTVEDAEAFLQWFDTMDNTELREAVPELVKETRTPAVSVIKDTFTPKGEVLIDDATGEVVPGLHHEPPETSFIPKPEPLL